MTASRGVGSSRRRAALGRGVAGGWLAVATGGVLRRMERDFTATGRLRTSTSALVYSTYATHAAMVAVATRRPVVALPMPAQTSTVIGTGIGVTGVGVFAASADLFPTTAQLSGTQTGALVTGGIYRWSRNPQYLAHLMVCVGLGVSRRSTDALVLAALAGGAFAYWIRREESNLARVFGSDYLAYRSRTARWLSLPPLRPTRRR